MIIRTLRLPGVKVDGNLLLRSGRLLFADAYAQTSRLLRPSGTRVRERVKPGRNVPSKA